jgi:hypothetical protein
MIWLTNYIIRVIKSRRMRLAGRLEFVWESRVEVLVGKPDGKRPLGETGLCGRIILMWIFRKWDVWAWTGLIWLRLRPGGGHL